MDARKILVATDFSEEAEVSLDRALRLARHVGGEIILLHVFDVAQAIPFSPASLHARADKLPDLAERLRRKDREHLSLLRERVEGLGVPISQCFVEGFPDAGIIDAAKDMKADLIVVGTLGRTGISRFLLGSVAEKVARHASTSVLVARGDRDDHAGGGGFSHILVPTDLSEGARHAGAMALAIAAPNARIEVLHAAGSLEGLEEIERGIQEWVDAAFAEMPSEDPPTVTQRVVDAPPAAAIVARVAEDDFDVVVMGSHGWRGMRPGLLGSVAERTIRHCGSSVLVARPPRQPADASS